MVLTHPTNSLFAAMALVLIKILVYNNYSMNPRRLVKNPNFYHESHLNFVLSQDKNFTKILICGIMETILELKNT